MNFEITFTPEQQEFQIRVRDWLKRNIPKGIEHPADPANLTKEGYEKQRELGHRLALEGWLYPTYPKEFGGGDLSPNEALIIEIELEKYDQILPPYYDSGGKLAAASIMVWGTQEQKSIFLPQILKGEVRTWQLLTEPEAGSDLANIQTTAIKNGNKYTVNGQKIYVGSSHGAEWSWMLANTDPGGKRHENLSWFIVPMDLPGITWAPMDLIFAGNENGALSGFKNTVYFADVQIPAENLIGGENSGWQVADTHLEIEHGLMQGSLLGDHNLRRTLNACRKLKKRGNLLIADPSIQGILAELYIDSEITRLFHIRNHWLRSSGQKLSYQGPQAYLQMKRQALRAAKHTQDILGPYALVTDDKLSPEDGFIEVQQRGSIVAQHPGGTVEIQKIIMSRKLGLGKSSIKYGSKN
ncbi:uncharacterized protein METZ01_LOCUS144594 [marine metagenome]|uniref:Acyl-CoA dehydrogenase/oxidase N-terminal domain-containing protein n=1 Tax=marine metagenome TaxID=408172 RepID=A0A381ZR71_9ZZZZ